MSGIDLRKYVSRRLAESQGHKLGRFRQTDDGFIVRCKRCGENFILLLNSTKRCASNIDKPCPGESGVT